MEVAVFILVIVSVVSVQADHCPDVSGVLGPQNVDNGTYPVPETLNWFAFSKNEGYTDTTYDDYTCITSTRTERILANGLVCQIIVVKGKPKNSKDYKEINTIYLSPENSENGWHISDADCKPDRKTLHRVIYDQAGGSYRSSYTRWYETEELKEGQCVKHVVRIGGTTKAPIKEEIQKAIQATSNFGIDDNDAYYTIPEDDCTVVS